MDAKDVFDKDSVSWFAYRDGGPNGDAGGNVVQTFEIEVDGNGGVYRYILNVEHDAATQTARAIREQLLYSDKPLIAFERGEVQIYNDDSEPGPSYTFDWGRSAVASVMERPYNTRLVWFQRRMERILVVSLYPHAMTSDAPGAHAVPSRNLSDFASWYRHIADDQGLVRRVTEALGHVLPGFSHFRFEKAGESHRVLKLHFANPEPGADIPPCTLGDLSDGQRAILALCVLVHFVAGNDYTLCIDEPDNYLALPDVQPWLANLYDSCSPDGLQALLISHHPEAVDYLAHSNGYWFYRDMFEPARWKRVAKSPDDLPVSEMIARRWFRDSVHASPRAV
jgi:hypothetical protein